MTIYNAEEYGEPISLETMGKMWDDLREIIIPHLKMVVKDIPEYDSLLCYVEYTYTCYMDIPHSKYLCGEWILHSDD